jgi:hypothetical protein
MPGAAGASGVDANLGEIFMLIRGGPTGYAAGRVNLSDAAGMFYTASLDGRDIVLPLSTPHLVRAWDFLQRKGLIEPLSQQDINLQSGLTHLFEDVVTMPRAQVDPVLMDICMAGLVRVMHEFDTADMPHDVSARRFAFLLTASAVIMETVHRGSKAPYIKAPVAPSPDQLEDMRARLMDLRAARSNDLADILMSDANEIIMKNPVIVDFDITPTVPRPH